MKIKTLIKILSTMNQEAEILNDESSEGYAPNDIGNVTLLNSYDIDLGASSKYVTYVIRPIYLDESRNYVED